MEKLTIAGKPAEWFPAEGPGAPLVVLCGEDGEGEAVYGAVKEFVDADFSLAAIGGLDWDAELTPWPAPGIGKGRQFSGGAEAWLSALTGALPSLTTRLNAPPRWTGLAGYSLAGLFAVYALYRTDAFARAASASGSMWYPGFADFAAENPLRRAPERLYLSLGDREGKARNPVMRPVEEATRRLAELYAEMGIPTRFELNPGGHFDEPVRRMAKGIAWMLAE